MISRFLLPLIKFFFFVTIIVLFYSYYIAYFGLLQGIYTASLVWSFFILCIPATHGKVIIGFPLYVITRERYYPEIFLWFMAIGLNIFTYLWAPNYYTHSIISSLLYRIIAIPNPYWIIIAVSALGTFYNYAMRSYAWEKKKYWYHLIRFSLWLISLTTLIYFTHQDFAFLCNSKL